MLKKKVTSVAMSAVLAATLCPGLAMAAPLEAGSAAPEQAPATLGTQAKKTVWVQEGYSYNESTGLLSEYAGFDLKYSGVNLKSATRSDTSSGYYDDDDNWVPSGKKYTYKYAMKSKGGKVKSAKYTSSESKNTTQYSYSYNKSGKLKSKKTVSKQSHLYGAKSAKAKKYSSSVTKYTLKKGRPVTARTTTKYADGGKYTSAKTTYAYDGKGNLKKVSVAKHKDDTTTYKNKYQSGRLIKRTIKSDSYYSGSGTKYDGYTYESEYSYKAIKVPAKYVSTVKAQQWALLNRNLNGALGPLYGGYYGD